MIKYEEFITPEEYMELRKMVGWVEFPIEQARACIEKAYMIQCVRDDEKAIGVVRLLWDLDCFGMEGISLSCQMLLLIRNTKDRE